MIAGISAGQSFVDEIEDDLKAELIFLYGSYGGAPDYIPGDPDNPTWEGVPQVLRDAFNTEVVGYVSAVCIARAQLTMPAWNPETDSVHDLPKVVVTWSPLVPGGQIVNDDADDNRLDFPQGTNMDIDIVEYEKP